MLFSKKKKVSMSEAIEKLKQDIIEDNFKNAEDRDIARENLEVLMNIQKEENKIRTSGLKSIDINTLITAGVSILSLILILNYEKKDVITSKAFSIFQKGFRK